MHNTDKTTAPIKLTPEQVISLIGHGATQEQLDGVRRELDAKIDRVSDKLDKVHSELEAKIDRVSDKVDKVHSELDAKIDRVSDKVDKVHSELDAKIDRVSNKIDSKFNQILAVFFANIAGMIALAYWLGNAQ